MKKQLDQDAIEWIEERSLLLAKSLNETSKVALRKTLAEGFANGEDIKQLSKRVSAYFDEANKWRAPMVARSEVIAASNEGALHRYEDEGIDRSEFYPSPDACPECVSLAGEYPTKEVHGMIPVHPNCRCTFLPIV